MAIEDNKDIIELLLKSKIDYSSKAHDNLLKINQKIMELKH